MCSLKSNHLVRAQARMVGKARSGPLITAGTLPLRHMRRNTSPLFSTALA
jgi:hypothetical protein